MTRFHTRLKPDGRLPSCRDCLSLSIPVMLSSSQEAGEQFLVVQFVLRQLVERLRIESIQLRLETRCGRRSVDR